MTHQNERRPASGDRKRPIFYRSLAKFLALSIFSNLPPFTASLPALGSGAGQAHQAGRDSVADEKDVRPLERGNSVKRELSGGQRHSYRLRLKVDQYLKAIVRQQGIDVVVQISGPGGNQMLEFDSERRPQAQEQVSLVAEVSGDYLLVVQPKQQGAAAGSYEIRIEELRAAAEKDRVLHEAYKSYQESFKLFGAGKYDEALKSAQHALEIRERLLGKDHRDTGATLNILAALYHTKGDYSKAEELYQRTLLIREKALGPDHPAYSDTLNNLAILYRGKGDFVKAESLFQRVLLITEKALGSDHSDVAASLNSLANLYFDKADYAKAEPLYQRALLTWEKALGPDHPNVANSLVNLSNLSAIKGDYAKAEPLYLRALSIREKNLGEDHPQVANSVSNLAALYDIKGDYAKAEILYRRALNILEKALGRDHPDVAFSLNNLATLYREKGDYEKAEPLFERALLINEKALGLDHPEVATSLNNLAVLYRNKGDYVKAESLFKRALLISEKALGYDHPDVAAYLNSLAILYYEKGDYVMAELLYRRALLTWEKALGTDTHQVASALANLGNLYTTKGDYEKAEPLYERALAIKEKVLGPDHQGVAEIFDNLARLYSAKGDFTQAVKFQAQANSVSERALAHNLAAGSERQKLAYLALFSKQTGFTLRLHSQATPDNPQALGLAFTTLLRRKGRGLDVMANTIATLRRHATPQDQNLFDRLAEARSQLSALIFRESESSKPESYQTRIKPIKEKIENLESELSDRSKEFRTQIQPITLSAVQSALPASSVLIEFVIYTPEDPLTGKTEPPRYLAYLLAPKGPPEYIDLGEAAAIERALDAWRQSLRENSVDVKQLGRSVDELVMRPVRSLFSSESGQIRHLLIAPDGALNLIPFAALVDEKNRYLIERYAISYLTSGSELLRLRNPQPSKSAPLVLANPLFGGMASVAMRGSRNLLNSASGDREGDQGETRGDPARIFFPPLPGTEGEALAIKAMMPEARLLQRDKATESVLKQIIGPQILHIATHGFFLDYQEASMAEDNKPESVSPIVTRSVSAPGAKYTVQLEATPMLETARARKKLLIEWGIDAYLLKSRLKGKGTFYRVRAGNFLNFGEAQKYGVDLREKGVAGEYFVARYIPPQVDLLEPEATIAGPTTKGVSTTSLMALPVNQRQQTETGSELRLSNFAARVKDPLLRSGLALAGANNGKSGDDDGLLTALEVAGLDLWGTKLVVLSACDTGLGEIKNGEGVQGLRRALVLAGSESQVISLWAVPDELAKDVIIPYYNALRRGEGRGEGLRQVQLRMLRSRNLRHPFYWAAFIQSGEWANLDGRR